VHIFIALIPRPRSDVTWARSWANFPSYHSRVGRRGARIPRAHLPVQGGAPRPLQDRCERPAESETSSEPAEDAAESSEHDRIIALAEAIISSFQTHKPGRELDQANRYASEDHLRADLDSDGASYDAA
jgi:hypothetical protein